MSLRRTTDDENARSALECDREAAAFPWTVPSDINCSVPIYRDDGGRRPPLQPDALRSLPQPHSKAVAAATALQGAFGTVIFMTASGEAASQH